MKEFTKDTYGCILYQEQVMQACVHLGGMSYAEADKVRKIIGKKKDAREFDAFKDKFVSGASQYINQSSAEKLWHDFEAHAGYSFNKSHAVAYSMISYWTAWLKKYYPHEFMFALLKNEHDKDTRTDYLIEAKRMNISVRLPHVNESDIDFTLEGSSIRFGLGNIKYISENIANKLIENRPYTSYKHLIEVSSTKGSGINSRAIDALNKIGASAFDDHPRDGSERENFYEYLNIPEFVNDVPNWLKAYFDDLENYEEVGCFIFMAMVKSIKRGDGWSRVEVVDKTGGAGIFHDQDTEIEAGRVYVFLAADNRIVNYVAVEDIKDINNPFVKYLQAKTLILASDEFYVVDFSARKTKRGDKMASVVLASEDKQLTSVVVFPSMYSDALVNIKVGGTCKPILENTKTGSLTLKGFIK
jgi:DNA polymerase-3 subunit alpha